LLMYPTNNGNFLECDSSITLLLDNIEKIKYQSKSLDEDRNGLEKELIEIIKDNDGIKDGEKVIVTYKANAKGSKILLIKKRG
ncbi:MAG TPA: hypothetical protein VKR58_10880, partial [Aquella sp.]|nr:hypothetical protein [Aquella sp.]